MPDSFNIAEYLPQRAQSAPDRLAVICSHAPDDLGRRQLTFAELNAESDRLARGLSAVGIAPGMRTLLMVRPGLDFVALTFALFKLGAICVLIDPGMGKKNLLDCVKQVKPEAFVAVSLAHALRVLAGGDAFTSVRISVTVGRRWFWGGANLARVRKLGDGNAPFPIAPTTTESPAAILFTTGSTGIPKGVLYNHGMFGAQVKAIHAHYKIEPGEVDLPAFPLFALFSTALGTTCVIPDMDPTRPAQCDPAKIVRAIQQHRVTYTFGSPSIWKRVGPYCLKQNITLPSLKRILMAGAPVKGPVLAPFAKILSSDGDTFIPYGATESLPLTSMRGSEVLNETWELTRQGRGHCVGRPLPGITIKIIRTEENLDPEKDHAWDESRVLPQGEIGEIVASGDVVTREYYNLPGETRKAKLRDAATGAIWHRIGDMGYFDEKGRLWFCGRKAHRVITADGTTLYSVCVEAVFESFITDTLKGVAPKLGLSQEDLDAIRVALVGIGPRGAQTPVIVFETSRAMDQFIPFPEFDEWMDATPLAKDVKELVKTDAPFPVDIRHNAKINREQLGQWAAARIAKTPAGARR